MLHILLRPGFGCPGPEPSPPPASAWAAITGVSGIYGLGFRGLGVLGLGVRVWGLGLGLGSGVWGVGFLEFRILGVRFEGSP